MTFKIRFVNRNEEIKALTEWASDFHGLPLYIYGPEGCGKTRLLKEFVKKFDKYFGEKAVAIYIDALERESIEKALITPKSIKIAVDTLASIVEKSIELSIGKTLIESISLLLEKTVTKRRLKNNYILIAIDDVVKAIGSSEIERYVKWLYELLWKLAEEYRPKSINFIVTTSEGESLELVSRHRHTHIRLLWNLDKKSFEKLYYELNPPQNLDFEEVWMNLGGNPGKLVELAMQFKWNIGKMRKYYENLLKPVVIKIVGEKLLNEFEAVLKNIDTFSTEPTARKKLLEKILVEKNLILYKEWITLHETNISSDSEIGVGETYAWQTPLYRDIFKSIYNNYKLLVK